jgi:hypothetical protein
MPVNGLSVASPFCNSRNAAPDVQAEIRKVTLATKDILVDTVAQTIYASVPGSAGASGNSVVTLDPASGTTGTPVFVGSEPDILALSGDRHFLYVGLDGEAAVRRFDTTTQTAGLRVPLGSGEFGSPVYAEDIEVIPGAPGTIAVARRVPGIGGSHEGVVIYDEDVARPTMSDRTRSNNSRLSSPRRPRSSTATTSRPATRCCAG